MLEIRALIFIQQNPQQWSLDLELPPLGVKTWMGGREAGHLAGSNVTPTPHWPLPVLFLTFSLPYLFFFFAFLPCFCPFLAPHFVFCSFSFLHLSNDFISFSPIPSPLLTQNTWITHYFKLLVVFFEWAWCFLVLDFEWQAEHNI